MFKLANINDQETSQMDEAIALSATLEDYLEAIFRLLQGFLDDRLCLVGFEIDLHHGLASFEHLPAHQERFRVTQAAQFYYDNVPLRQDDLSEHEAQQQP